MANNYLYSYSEHHGPDICEHYMFVPDTDFHAGYMLYIYEGDYTLYDVCARLFIDHDNKHLFFQSIKMSFACHFWGEEKDYTGGFKAFKKLEESQNILKTFTERFLGQDWRYSLRFTKYHSKRYVKQYKSKIGKLIGAADIPSDIITEIAKKRILWKDTSTKVNLEDISNLKDVFSTYIGSFCDDGWGKYYAWNKLIAVNLRSLYTWCPMLSVKRNV